MEQTITKLKTALCIVVAVAVLGCSSLGLLLYKETQESEEAVYSLKISEQAAGYKDQQIDELKTEVASLEAEVATLEAKLNPPSTSSSGSYSGGSTSSTSNTQSVTVYVTKTGSKYHKNGCQYLSQSKIPISLSKAKSAGYVACSVCY